MNIIFESNSSLILEEIHRAEIADEPMDYPRLVEVFTGVIPPRDIMRVMNRLYDTAKVCPEYTLVGNVPRWCYHTVQTAQ